MFHRQADYFRRPNADLARQSHGLLPHPALPLDSIPSDSTSKAPRSPYISSRHPSSSWLHSQRGSRSPSSLSSTLDDVFAPGDVFGEGSTLQGEHLRKVSIGSATPPTEFPDHEKPAKEFEVERRLGAGSYAVVYLVKEILYRPSSLSDDCHVGSMELGDQYRPSTVYGRQYAIKCLSKANLDEEALAAQMSEVTIHQSLRSHPNIVTLHRTLETSAFLLLLLEYVPGEDLFYFLEQSRDHYSPDYPHSPESSSSSDNSMFHSHSSSSHSSSSHSHSNYSGSSTRTPPTPSLLSAMQPSQLLSRTRLRLIASMFAQMCDAVAACHAQQVYHRDIKPENFIVTDGWTTEDYGGRRERKVVVKLTDFGLSTTDVDSSDMDCGSAPYMSYECRNNIAPTYRPRAADVWSLGIVLINMLYHVNPWTDTAQGACNSFELYRRDPVNFFMTRFSGMTLPVAEFLASRVFNVLSTPQSSSPAISSKPKLRRGVSQTGDDDSKRISAHDFGVWVRDLPDLLGEPLTHPIHKTRSQQGVLGHKRVTSITSVSGYALSSSTPASHRPTSRAASRSTSTTRPPPGNRPLSSAGLPSGAVPRSRAGSLVMANGVAIAGVEASELSTVIDQEVLEEEAEEEQVPERDDDDDYDDDDEQEQERAPRYQDQDVQVEDDLESLAGAMTSRSTSTNKRRKRGARKGKGAAAATAVTGGSSAPSTPYPLSLSNKASLNSMKMTLPTPSSATVPPLPLGSPTSPTASTADETLVTLAAASQSLAREISQASKASSSRQSLRTTASTPSFTGSSKSRKGQLHEPASLFPVPTALLSGGGGMGFGVGGSVSLSRAQISLSTPSTSSVTPSPRPTPTHQSVGVEASTSAGPTPAQVASKKPSKWKLSFGKASAASLAASAVPSAASEPVTADASVGTASLHPPASSPPMSATASNVTSLLMGLNAPGPTPPPASQGSQLSLQDPTQSAASLPSVSSSSSSNTTASWGSRGRRERMAPPPLPPMPPASSLYAPPVPQQTQTPFTPLTPYTPTQRKSRSRGRAGRSSNQSSPHPSVERWNQRNDAGYDMVDRRSDKSPHSVRRNNAHGHVASSASSMVSGVSGHSGGSSGNWRNSMSTTSSTSAFTSYSNSSARSISTAATSVSSATSGSWRTGNGQKGSGSPRSPSSPTHPNGLPRNIKIMDGTPWILDELPRGQKVDPDYVRKTRARKPKDLKLDTINERPSGPSTSGFSPRSPDSYHAPSNSRLDAMTSTSDLSAARESILRGDDLDAQKKVQKGQINALAKMLSALRR